MTTTAKGSWLRAEASRRGHVRVEVFRGKSGTMYVPAEIDGQKARLIVDTGASRSFLDESAATRLDIGNGETRDADAAACGAGAGGAVSMRFTDVEMLAIGDLQVGRVEMGIMDLGGVLAQLKAVGDGAADGVVGSDLMAKHGAIVDVAGEALYLELAADKDRR